MTKKYLILAAVGLLTVAVGYRVSDHMLNKEVVAATPVYIYHDTSVPTPTREFTPKEQAFIDQACADAVNESMLNICKQAFIDTWDASK